LSISVEFLGRYRGKGVVAKQDFAVGDVMFTETPLVGALLIECDKSTACSYCFRSFVTAEQVFPGHAALVRETLSKLGKKTPIRFAQF
jgi:hypothetical protein